MSSRQFVTVALVWLLGTSVSQAQWSQRQSRTDASTTADVVHYHVVMQNTGGATATLDLARFSPKSTMLHVIDNRDQRDLAETMTAGNYLAGVNGGYFDEQFAPLGLRADASRTWSALRRGRLMSGLIVSTGSNIRILRTSEFSKSAKPIAGLQCGPFLVDHGRSVPGLEGTRPARRSFVATGNSQTVLVGVCSSPSVAELAAVLSSLTGELKIQRALNLDGGSSTAFWFKRADGTVLSVPEQKTVRDFLAISGK